MTSMSVTPKELPAPGPLLRLAATVATLATTAAGACAFAVVQSMGFPDGHLTELERAERVLYWIFIGTSCVAGVGYWGISRSGDPSSVGKRLRVATLFYVGSALLLIAFDFFLQRQLVGGGGG